MTTPELKFAVDNAIDVYEDAIGNTAIRTRQMISRYGPILALSKLVQNPDSQKGFRILRDQGKLDDSFEQVIINFANLFSKDTVERAKFRLENADVLDELSK